MDTPLYEAMSRYVEKGMARFHMPGHKGRLPFPLEQAAMFDLTEIQGMDSLYEASGVLAQVEERYTGLYGSAGSFLSAGGSTLCIQAMLALALRPGDSFLCARGAHTAAVNAMALLDLNLVWLYPESGLAGLMGEVRPEAVAEALNAHPEAKAVYLTSPNYYGILCDIEAISGICHEHGVPLLVDNAHGAHLRFLPRSLHPMNLGADLCADSLHKTLPVLTGGALLHCGNPRYIPDVKRKMALFGSTSPSYLIMLSCDLAIPYLENGIRADLEALCRRFSDLRETACRRGFSVLAGTGDPLRLTVDFGEMGYTGEEFADYLRENRVEPEYMGERHCVFLGGTNTSTEDLDCLEQALLRLPKRPPFPAEDLPFIRPEKAISIRDAVLMDCECIPVDLAEGRIAGGYVAPCPPGIPVLLPGERIGGDLIVLLKSYGIFEVIVVK